MKITLEQRLRASAGPTAYMRRLRRIEDTQTSFLRELRGAYEAALKQHGDAALAEARVRRLAALLDVAALNVLIEHHNRYYPIEANLRTDVRTRVLMDGTEPWKPMPKVTADDLVRRATAGP